MNSKINDDDKKLAKNDIITTSEDPIISNDSSHKDIKENLGKFKVKKFHYETN